ncbi:MAG: phosphoribosylformylglycinamidine synthase subunit PurQ [SAR324 cluster bacterium]|nr:phosphoribosylformylglycinamidine synthase subunit PurQ [SAR324 cluster bacterium]
MSHRTAVLVFPGSNCDSDLFKAAQHTPELEPEYVWHTTTSLDGFELVLVPGGFSHGDYLRAGALAARSPVVQALRKVAAQGVPILGICNGFQVLTESGLLPGALQRNASLQFVCKIPEVEVATTHTPFTQSCILGARLRLPVAHGEGNYFCDAATLATLEQNGQVVFRYAEGHNPNGSLANIAGITNAERNVLGLMPHPERAMTEWMGSADGQQLFTSAVSFLQN